MKIKTAKAMDGRTTEVPKRDNEFGTGYQGKDIVSISIPEGVTSIADGAFRGCRKLRDAVLPSTLERIGAHAFEECTELRLPKLPCSLKEIGEGAFLGCDSIEKFEIEDSNDCIIVYKGALYAKDWGLIAYPPGCREKKYETPEQTQTIFDLAFNGNPHIISIGIGPKVSSVTGRAFLGCSMLSDIWVKEGNDTYCSSEGFLYRDEGTTLVFVSPRPRKACIRLTGVNGLATSCLAGCDKLDILCLHDCLEDIAPDAFGDGCRPKKLFIDKAFDCAVPFKLAEPEEEPEGERVAGHIYRRGRDGGYKHIGFTYQTDDPSEEYDEIDFNMFGRDDEKPMGFHPVKVTDTRFEDIAGLEEAKELMYQHLILPSKHPELFDRFDLEGNTGVLMYGPPGTGKTMLARAVASEMDAQFYSIKSTDIRDCWVGVSESNIKKLFETARNDRRAVIFFDDFDSLGRSRGNSSEPWQSDLIDEILVQMQGLEKHTGNLMVLAATNRPWEIDSALMRSGRFSTHIHVGLPNRDAREAIVRNRISKIPHSDDIDFKEIAERTEGYNAADVEEVCKTAKMRRISMLDSGNCDARILKEDLDFAISKIHSSVSKKDLREIEEYERTGSVTNGSATEESYCPTGDIPPGYC